MSDSLYRVPKLLTQEVLREVFDYVDGELIYKVRTACRVQIGRKAGVAGNHGYLCVRLAYTLYQVHNLIWLWHYGVWPKSGHELDHRDENKLNNRINNLREATRVQNSYNKPVRRDSGTGLKGVYANRRGTFDAYAKLDGKRTYLGAHPTAEAASEVYQTFARSHHGEFYRALP